MRARLAAACLLTTSVLLAQTDYPLTPDSVPQRGVPAGTVTRHGWTSTIFPGTVRDYWVYVPAQYRADSPAAVMVFQDGGNYVDEKGRWRVPIVFDNLIHTRASCWRRSFPRSRSRSASFCRTAAAI